MGFGWRGIPLRRPAKGPEEVAIWSTFLGGFAKRCGGVHHRGPNTLSHGPGRCPTAERLSGASLRETALIGGRAPVMSGRVLRVKSVTGELESLNKSP